MPLIGVLPQAASAGRAVGVGGQAHLLCRSVWCLWRISILPVSAASGALDWGRKGSGCPDVPLTRPVICMEAIDADGKTHRRTGTCCHSVHTHRLTCHELNVIPLNALRAGLLSPPQRVLQHGLCPLTVATPACALASRVDFMQAPCISFVLAASAVALHLAVRNFFKMVSER